MHKYLGALVVLLANNSLANDFNCSAELHEQLIFQLSSPLFVYYNPAHNEVPWRFNCSWRFKAGDESHFLRFTLTELNLHWCRNFCEKCSHLAFYSVFPNGTIKPILKRQCQSSAPSHSFTSETNEALVVFHVALKPNRMYESDFFYHSPYWAIQKGPKLAFVLSHSEVSDNSNDEDYKNCQHSGFLPVITGEVGTFGTIQSYTTSAGRYRSNEYCQWLITSPNPHAVIRFSFRHADLEDSCSCKIIECYEACTSDHITVWNGNQIFNSTNSGDYFKSVAEPKAMSMRKCGLHFYYCIFQSSTNEALVVFQTNERVEFSGFILDYEIVNADHLPARRGDFEKTIKVIDTSIEPSGSIASSTRSDNGNYRSHENAQWFFIENDGAKFMLSMKFSYFELESYPDTTCQSQPDRLFFHGKTDCFSGKTISPNRTFDILHENGVYRFIFATNGYNEYRGFNGTFQRVPLSDSKYCNETNQIEIKLQERGEISNYIRQNGVFRRRENCAWLLTAEMNARIKLKIVNLLIDPCPHNASSCQCNNLTVIDGTDRRDLRQESFCGFNVSFNQEFVSSGPSAIVVFQTAEFDPNYPDDPLGSGFIIEYEMVEPYDFIADNASTITQISLALAIAAVIGIVVSLLTRRHFKMKEKTLEKNRRELVSTLLGDLYIIPLPNFQKILQELGCSEYAQFIEKMSIPSERILVEERNSIIGQGAFGVVKRGRLMPENVEIALKGLTSQPCEDFLREGLIMQTLNHENVLKVLGVTLIQGEANIVFPYMPDGNLRDFSWGRSYALKMKIDFCRQICSGMAYLSSRDCIHRDLACRNILVGENMDLKISDFGFARHLDPSQSMYYWIHEDTNIPVRWYPPESLQAPHVFKLKSDVWSFGVCCWEVFEAEHEREPYGDKNGKQVVEFVCKEKGCLSKPIGCPIDFYEKVMLQSWAFDIRDRPGFEELLPLVAI